MVPGGLDGPRGCFMQEGLELCKDLPCVMTSSLARAQACREPGPTLRPWAGRHAAATVLPSDLRKAAFNKDRSRGERAYCSALRRARGEFLSEYLLFRALTLVRPRSLFVDLDDGLTPSATTV
jgi:hypothetical protein